MQGNKLQPSVNSNSGAVRLSLEAGNTQRWGSGRSPDSRLLELRAFPVFPVATCSVLSVYSCGAVADFHRASQ